MIANVVKDLVQVVLVKATGAAKVSGTIYVVARLELDGDDNDGMYWCSTHSAWEASPHAFPTATYELGGAWAYQRPAGMTTSKVSATKPARIWSRMTDNAAAPESETACSSELEEMIYSSGAAEAATGAAASVTGAVGSVTSPVTAGTVSDKTGYSLTTAPLDAAGTRTALGLGSANLDTQLGTIVSSASSAASSSSSAATDASTAASQATAANSKAADLQTRVPATLVDGRMDSSIGAFPLVIDGTIDGAAALKSILSMARGNFTKTGDSYAFKDQSGTTIFTIAIAAGGRTVT